MNTLMQNPVRSLSEIYYNAMDNAMTYGEYRELVSDLATSDSNSGPEVTPSLVNYTQLNNKRMNRWDKTLKISEEIKNKVLSIKTKTTWVVLTESWCGDAAPSLPVMNKLAELNPNIELKIVLRDENLELMDLFLTNGARSIPKLVSLNSQTKEIISEWGPRSTAATKMVEEYKAEHGQLTAEFKQDLQIWYNKDKGQDILNDLANLLALK